MWILVTHWQSSAPPPGCALVSAQGWSQHYSNYGVPLYFMQALQNVITLDVFGSKLSQT